VLGHGWPCPVRQEFPSVWRGIGERLAVRGQSPGRGAFGGWDDGDSGLVRVAWCLVRHLRPTVVVETGVARGVTTATVLRALADNGGGHLWSIDLPPLTARGLAVQTGMAVDVADRPHWTMLRGSSRKLLPGLVGTLGRIDLFVHDSMHTGRNVSFELDHVWPVLATGGVAIVDDADRNAAFGDFARAHPNAPSFVFRADDGRALFGCVLKP
jgi:hypothetical protein